MHQASITGQGSVTVESSQKQKSMPFESVGKFGNRGLKTRGMKIFENAFFTKRVQGCIYTVAMTLRR